MVMWASPPTVTASLMTPQPPSGQMAVPCTPPCGCHSQRQPLRTAACMSSPGGFGALRPWYAHSAHAASDWLRFACACSVCCKLHTLEMQSAAFGGGEPICVWCTCCSTNRRVQGCHSSCRHASCCITQPNLLPDSLLPSPFCVSRTSLPRRLCFVLAGRIGMCQVASPNLLPDTLLPSPLLPVLHLTAC